MKGKKGKADNITWFLVLILLGFIGMYAYSQGWFGGVTAGVTPTTIPTVPTGCDLPANPTVTIDTPDLYGGAAVTTKNIYREVETSTWTEVAGAASFEADPGDVVDIVFGIGDNAADTDDEDEPFGCKIRYTVPCKSEPMVSAAKYCPGGGVIDDAVEGDITIRLWDPEDGTVITEAAPVDIDNGDVFSIKMEIQGAYEEDYGNRFCDKGNLMVVKYPTGNFTNVYITDVNGNKLPTGTVPPTLFTTAANYGAKGFEMPVLKSNILDTYFLVTDASGSGKAPDGGDGNITLYLYDVNWYIDNDVTPPEVVSGWEDEDGDDIGSTGAASTILNITID